MEHLKQVMRRCGLNYKVEEMTDDQRLQLGLIAAVESLASAVSDCEDRLADIRNEIRDLREDDKAEKALHGVEDKLDRIYNNMPDA
jgi:septation ring formation regulator EzrA